MSGPLSEARVRAQRVQYRDGISEISAGIIMLLSGGSTFLMVSGDGRSSWSRGAAMGAALVLVALATFAPRIIAAIRRRVTYPRSGYVNFAKFSRYQKILIAVILTLLSMLGSMLASRYELRGTGQWDRWVPAGTGLVIGATFVYVSLRQDLLRFLVVGIFSGVLGVALSIGYHPWDRATLVCIAGISCALLCSGGVALRNYLRSGPPVRDVA